MPEPERLVAIAAVMIVVFAGGVLFGQWARNFPGPVRAAGYAVGVLVAAAAAGVWLNATTEIPPTPGVRLFAGMAVPCALVVAYGALWSWRHRNR